MNIPYEPSINEHFQRIARDCGIQLNTTILEENLEQFAKRVLRDVVLEIGSELTSNQLFNIINMIETRYGKFNADARPTKTLQDTP